MDIEFREHIGKEPETGVNTTEMRTERVAGRTHLYLRVALIKVQLTEYCRSRCQ